MSGPSVLRCWSARCSTCCRLTRRRCDGESHRPLQPTSLPPTMRCPRPLSFAGISAFLSQWSGETWCFLPFKPSTRLFLSWARQCIAFLVIIPSVLHNHMMTSTHRHIAATIFTAGWKCAHTRGEAGLHCCQPRSVHFSGNTKSFSSFPTGQEMEL